MSDKPMPISKKVVVAISIRYSKKLILLTINPENQSNPDGIKIF